MTTVMEMAADLAREGHRAARDVSEARTKERSEGRFGGQNHQGGQRSGGARRSGGSDAIFTPELTKTSKDSKRERDRENKNKKKDFDKTSGGGHRPNQGGRNQMSRIPKALQKPAPQPEAGREEAGDQGDHNSGEAYHPRAC